MAEPIPDSTAVMQALRDTALYRTLLDQVSDGIYVVDRDRRIVYWQRGAQEITGYGDHEVVGKFCHADLLMHCDANGNALCGSGCPLAQTMDDGMPRDCTIFLRHRHGHRLPVQVRALPVYDPAGEIVGAIEMFQQATPSREQQGALHAFGCMDPITGLSNRAYGELLAQQALAAWERFELPFGWIRFDLNNGEDLCRRYGHGVLHAVLLLIARTLANNVGLHDFVSYWGDSQFRVGTHYAWGEDLEDLARRLAVLVRASNVEWWGSPVQISVSIGVTAGRLGDTVESLESRAGECMTTDLGA